MRATGLILLLLVVVALPVSAQPGCTGTTEELLQCHAPEIKEFLKQWVRAWGDGDIDTYLDQYTTVRSPRDGMSRHEWILHRRARVGPEKKIEINLKLESMGLEDSGIFDVIFTQHYQSATYRDQVRKRLFLIREEGRLKIWKEEVLR